MMITTYNSLNETTTTRCISGDSISTLIPVGCLGGRLYFQPVVRKRKSSQALSLDPALNITQYSEKTTIGRKGQATDGDSDEYHDILEREVWNKDYDTW